MVVYRCALESEREECLKLVNDVFHGIGVQIQFEEAWKKVYNPQIPWQDFHFVAADDEKGIRGVIGCLPNLLHIGGETLKVGYLGSVSVHPDARGEGHMKALMQLVYENAQNTGIDLLVLGGRRQRYAYYGYETGGLQYDFTLLDSCVRHAFSGLDTVHVRFEPIVPGGLWEKEAEALHVRQWAWMERKPSFAQCSTSYMSRLYAAIDGDTFLGYLLTYADSMNITEVRGASPNATDTILKAWQEKNNLKSFRLSVPAWDVPMLRHMWGCMDSYSSAINARVRVVNWRGTVERLLRLKAMGTPLRDGEWTLNIEGEDCFTVCVKRNEVCVTDAKEKVPPRSISQAETLLFDPLADVVLPGNAFGWFPLPLCILLPDAF